MPSEADDIKVSSEGDLENEPDYQSSSIGSEKLANLVQKEAQEGHSAHVRKNGPSVQAQLHIS